jgi:hypothetical protein
LLLIGHVTLVVFSFLLSLGIAMSTNVCAYQDCGDEKWVHYALPLVMWVAPALLFVDLVVSIALKATGRRGFMHRCSDARPTLSSWGSHAHDLASGPLN